MKFLKETMVDIVFLILSKVIVIRQHLSIKMKLFSLVPFVKILIVDHIYNIGDDRRGINVSVCFHFYSFK